MNNIKTVPRTKLSQAKLNNLFKVATGALTGEEYDPQVAIDHWMDLSKQGDKVKDGKIHLQCGQEVPNIFRLKSAYKTRTGTTKASIIVSETTSTELMNLPIVYELENRKTESLSLENIISPNKVMRSHKKKEKLLKRR